MHVVTRVRGSGRSRLSGFALISQRTDTLKRMYFQCDPDEDPGAWSDGRIWDELQARVTGLDGFTLKEGPITDTAILRFCSFVAEPMRYSRLLAGDAAHTVPPTGAKGLNLALADVRVLAEVLERAVRHNDPGALDEYGPRALARVWKAQHFSLLDDHDAARAAQCHQFRPAAAARRTRIRRRLGSWLDDLARPTPAGRAASQMERADG